MNTRLIRCFPWLVAGALATLGLDSAQAQVADTRDPYPLFKQRLINRQLFEQLRAPEQEFRMGDEWETVAYAVDASAGSVQNIQGDSFARFHGFFVFDNFVALRSPYGLDVNLNLALFNPSSSDGVRVSSYALAGGAVHFYHDFRLGNDPARIDVLGTDLDLVTLGSGLILERWPLEGVLGNLAVGDFYLRHYFGGRVFWPNDDLYTLQLGAWEGRLEAMVLGWQFRAGPPRSWYADVSGFVPLFDDKVRLRGEVAANLRTTPRFGLLGRADYRDGEDDFSWHIGYQFRWYEQGFGPLRALLAPSTTFNLPYRAEEYVTNSFEYFGTSEYFEQWSHTLMAETEVPLFYRFRAFAEVEALALFAEDRSPPVQYVESPAGRPAPGRSLDTYYRSGLRLYPWSGLPHRLSVVFTNKQVESLFFIEQPTELRFRRSGHYIMLQVEASL